MKKRSVNQVKGGGVKQYRYTVLFEPQEGGYNVIVPAIPEICTFGETMQEARKMAQDAIRCYLESALKHGETIPKDAEPTTERLAVSL
ncbi:MAG: type II toxin-antitoxin system HicB family antitoxin [Acidobacteriota bacterium]